jgi:hypothetical protein
MEAGGRSGKVEASHEVPSTPMSRKTASTFHDPSPSTSSMTGTKRASTFLKVSGCEVSLLVVVGCGP